MLDLKTDKNTGLVVTEKKTKEVMHILQGKWHDQT